MTMELKVAGMTCGHCVKAVTGAIRARDPAAKVEVVLAEGLVRADTTLPRAEVAAAVEEEGYKVAS
ncbi:MAG TPA: cation transporter [Falsiroseomonas sp.]|jgi:copper chaperone|nr:cation transporter [Falsiroseomonas sp.]